MYKLRKQCFLNVGSLKHTHHPHTVLPRCSFLYVSCSLIHSLFVRVRYQFAFKTILDGLEKAVARTVRAVQNKSDEIAQVAANIEELELEIGEAMDE